MGGWACTCPIIEPGGEMGKASERAPLCVWVTGTLLPPLLEGETNSRQWLHSWTQRVVDENRQRRFSRSSAQIEHSILDGENKWKGCGTDYQ
ncbi:hypothetical protein HNY73_015771 [Argiope bruennichi]|uniref:Uncharacterized protein n=1 Tax=Argiope bruennichi TaxID=94029 RepID=A0A8T0EGR9_ARGBR|nr:hypothetical protein HNY73_015771 [Argiope bruennichi]